MHCAASAHIVANCIVGCASSAMAKPQEFGEGDDFKTEAAEGWHRL